jgi:hypothetical protein
VDVYGIMADPDQRAQLRLAAQASHAPFPSDFEQVEEAEGPMQRVEITWGLVEPNLAQMPVLRARGTARFRLPGDYRTGFPVQGIALWFHRDVIVHSNFTNPFYLPDKDRDLVVNLQVVVVKGDP